MKFGTPFSITPFIEDEQLLIYYGIAKDRI